MFHNIARFCRVLPLLAAAFLLAIATPGAAETVDLSPRPGAAPSMRVTVNFEAGGSALIRVSGNGEATSTVANNSAGAAAAAPVPVNEQTQLPVSVTATLVYDERILTPSATGSASVPPRLPLAVRYYTQAEATIKVDKGGLSPRLAESRRTIVVENQPVRPMLYSPAGPIPREELDLIDVIGNSAVVDRLLPTRPVAQGESWKTDANAMAALLTFDHVSVCEVESVLEEFNASFAKIRAAGVVHGTADGTPTEQEVRAVALFDRRLGRIARLNIAAREKRSIGAATPGLDAVAKLQIKLEPAPADSPLTDNVIASAARSRRAANDVLLEVPAMGLRLVHDRDWFLTAQNRQAITLRRLAAGEVVGQVTLTSLPPKSPAQTSLEQFQSDVVRSLGQNFGEMVAARQWLTPRRYYTYGVVARGSVQEVPIEWHYYLVAQDTGHRISAATTVEGAKAAQLGQADRQLVESLELFPPVVNGTQASAATPVTK
jgi:hypothetical protein